jgi:hypothetical protein
MKRITWFVAGAAAGATSAGYATRKIKSTAAQLAPVNVARGAAGRAKLGSQRVVAAVDQLLVDGQPVDSGRVIVLKQRR